MISFTSKLVKHKKYLPKRGGVDINVVFYFEIIVMMVLLWFLLAFAYKPIGKFFKNLYNDSKREMMKEKNEEE